jgi:hypothetical protein
MKKLAAAICLALPLLGGCVVYGPGPAANGAWAGYDHGYEYGLSGYDRPVTYRNDYAYGGGYGGGFSAGYNGGYGGVQAEVGVGNGGYYGSYYDYGY